MNEVQVLRHIGADILLRHVPIVKVKYKKVEYRVTNNRDEQMEEYITPVGTIQQITKKSETGKTSFLAKNFIANKEEAKILQYVYENRICMPDYSTFIDQQKYIGDDGLATVSSPLTPIQHLLQIYMHIEPFVYGMYDYQDTLEELMEVMHEANLREYKVIADSPVFAVFSYEDTSTTVISPSWYDKYCKDYINQYADIMHKNEKVFITHMCGKLKGFASSIKEGMMDGIDSVCPPTTGDTQLQEALEMWPDKVIIRNAYRLFSMEKFLTKYLISSLFSSFPRKISANHGLILNR